jgi:hypothetical protein
MTKIKIGTGTKPEDNSIILFFSKDKVLFPVVHPHVFWNDIQEAAEKMARLTNAKYTGFTMSVKQWNKLVFENTDPVDLMSELIQSVEDSVFTSDEAYGVMSERLGS